MKNQACNNFQYKVFDLCIQSEFPLDGLISNEVPNTADVLVRYGKNEEPLPDLPNTIYEEHLIYNPSFYFVRVARGIGSFMVRKQQGKTIVLFDLKNAAEKQTALAWFYGLVLSGILQLNNLFAFHASGILHEGHLHLFCGNSGMGKSTLAAQLKSRGYPLFTDDKCVVRKTDESDVYIASPGLQVMRLWENSILQIQHDGFLTDQTPVVFKSKKSQFRIKADALIRDAQPLKSIYILANVAEDKPLNCIPVTGVRKLRLLRKQIFRHDMVKGFGKEAMLWDFLQQLVQNIPVYVLHRPKQTPIPIFGDFVEQVITKS